MIWLILRAFIISVVVSGTLLWALGWFSPAALITPSKNQSNSVHNGGYNIGDRLEPLVATAVPDNADLGKLRDLSWDELIPPDWQPEKLFDDTFGGMNEEALALIEDSDPNAQALLKKLRELWDSAPTVDTLNGERIRLPGFVVPIEGDDQQIREFLLVPYFGACIHMPPPPANQIIHVLPEANQSIPARWNMMPVWVSGQLEVIRHSSAQGISGYRIQNAHVVEYEQTAETPDSNINYDHD